MDLLRELETLQRNLPLRGQDEQMRMVDALEKTLAQMGVRFQPKFEISLASRVISTENVNQLA